MYYSDEARASAVKEIRDCISKISEVPGDHLSYLDATKTTRFLSELIYLIEKEGRDIKKRRVRNG
jgi:hypothetical protein